MTKKIALYGCGRMGSAMAAGWLGTDRMPQISVYAPRPTLQVRSWLSAGLVTLNAERVPADILVIAVKPQVFDAVSEEILSLIGPDTLVVSVMAAWSVQRLAEKLGTSQIIRALPSTPGSVGKGVTLISADASVSADALEMVRELLLPLGWVEGPMSESDLQIAMTISGSGPAYVFHLVEALAEAGCVNGLSKDLSMRLARRMVIGAGALLAASPDQDAGELREAVTSPRGVTAAALEVLMNVNGFTSLTTEAVKQAVARDQTLARGED
jgi:pyrroline-5-carboxylate reductase